MKSQLFDTPFETYEAGQILGEGGSGHVYKATSSAGKVVAIKALSPERITTDKLKRFKNEVTFCQKSDHPAIVKVIDVGFILAKGRKCPFYVMQHYPSTLRSLLSHLDPEAALRIFGKMMDGVEAAHLHNVWHRDLKPENILCDMNGTDVAVADFGIAHFEEEEIYTAVETKATSRLANFQYSAPEQRVRGRDVDYRADFFALGLMLNEMFTGDVPQGSGYKTISDVNSEYAYLDEIVDSMLQNDPAQRPDSIEQIKKEFIGRKKEFIAMQRLDAAKQRVVTASEPDDFEPLSLIDFDYQNGTLTLKLDRNVPAGWVQEFQHPRGGHSSIMGYGPEAFHIRGDALSISVQENEKFIQELIGYVKKYVDMANRGYQAQLKEAAARREREEREVIEKSIKEAELRKRILSNVRL